MAILFVTGGENVLDGHVNAFPRCAPRLETIDGHPASGTVLLLSRNQVSNQFAVTGDCNRFSAFNGAQEVCEMGLGFSGLDFAHVSFFNWSCFGGVIKVGSTVGPV